ncbi:MAG: zinc-ribbon domain-containing protein [Actinomycetota bacterium]|nr:zinc-ribbon domain-containing protein [Actinomycetota bacterium]
MFCIHCGKGNQDGARLCAFCGQPLNDRTMALTLLPDEDAAQGKVSSAQEHVGDASFCIHCGTEVNPDALFCPQCGQPVNDRTMATVILAEDEAEEPAVGPDGDREGIPVEGPLGGSAARKGTSPCLACGADNDPDAVVCAVCGTPFPGHTMDALDLRQSHGSRSDACESLGGAQTMDLEPLSVDETVRMHPVSDPHATAEMPPIGDGVPTADTPSLGVLDAAHGGPAVGGNAASGSAAGFPAGAQMSSAGSQSQVPTPASTLFCMHCGASNKSTSQFCSRCGQRMGTTPSTRMTVSPPVGGGMRADGVTAVPMQSREGVNRSYRKVVILLVAILALLVVLSVFLTVDLFM